MNYYINIPIGIYIRTYIMPRQRGDEVHYLGQVRGLGYNGKLIVKGKFAPKLELEVVDNSMKVIGKIARVFGPVDSPYISIKPKKNHRPSLDVVGKAVYVKEKSK